MRDLWLGLCQSICPQAGAKLCETRASQKMGLACRLHNCTGLVHTGNSTSTNRNTCAIRSTLLVEADGTHNVERLKVHSEKLTNPTGYVFPRTQVHVTLNRITYEPVLMSSCTPMNYGQSPLTVTKGKELPSNPAALNSNSAHCLDIWWPQNQPVP